MASSDRLKHLTIRDYVQPVPASQSNDSAMVDIRDRLVRLFLLF